MHFRTETVAISCPYCGELFDIVIDPGVAETDFAADLSEVMESQQDYIEDCYVCCRPIHLTVRTDNSGAAEVVARSENEC